MSDKLQYAFVLGGEGDELFSTGSSTHNTSVSPTRQQPVSDIGSNHSLPHTQHSRCKVLSNHIIYLKQFLSEPNYENHHQLFKDLFQKVSSGSPLVFSFTPLCMYHETTTQLSARLVADLQTSCSSSSVHEQQCCSEFYLHSRAHIVIYPG